MSEFEKRMVQAAAEVARIRAQHQQELPAHTEHETKSAPSHQRGKARSILRPVRF
ncbi:MULTISPECIES: hypothetical protein [unclassified Corynebacterium]|nr:MULTISPECIES: hypothetical protein [unclassified Corynebacterium]MCS4491412.1 hypothetical protein [Corynebacterium sp. ES2715-CONJ3]MCS4531487.1 hypothetical protein [Corynebacterium sp. ES2730-CONJ]